jgi:hypothetical protein
MDESRRARLIGFLRRRTPAMCRKLEDLKQQGIRDRERPDFIWYFLLQSFSTMGNSRGWKGLMGTPENLASVTFDTLQSQTPAKRLKTLQDTLGRAKVRMPNIKAAWLVQDFALIQTLGGLKRARETAMAQPGAEGKITFLKNFAGIGDKYARNIWMDVYHPDFRNSIAVDERIKTVSAAIAATFPSYQAHEQFYLNIAREAGLDGWDVDRILYNFLDAALKSIGAPPS